MNPILNKISPAGCICYAVFLLHAATLAVEAAIFREIPVPSGTLAGPQFGSQRNPAAATNGNVVLVVWDDESLDGTKRIQAQRFSPDGSKLDPVAFDISSVPGIVEKPRHPAAAALPGGDFLVAWESKAAGVTMVSLPASGTPVLQQVRLGAGRDVEIASDGFRFLVTWHQNVSSSGTTVGVRVEMGPGGIEVTGPLATLALGREPVIAGGPGRFFLATLNLEGSAWRVLNAGVWPPTVEAGGTMDATTHAASADGSGVLYAFSNSTLVTTVKQIRTRRISWAGDLSDISVLPSPTAAGYLPDLAVALRADGTGVVAAQIEENYPSPLPGNTLWLWTLPPRGAVAPPILLNSVSFAQQDPEMLGTAEGFWVFWEDRRIDFLSDGNSDQEDIYGRLYSGNSGDPPEPEQLITESSEAGVLEPADLIVIGNEFRALYSQHIQEQPIQGSTLRRVWEAGSDGTARVIGFASGLPHLLPHPDGSLAMWNHVPYQLDGSDGTYTVTGMQAVRQDAEGKVTHFEQLPGWTTANGVVGGGGGRSGILTASPDALGNSYIVAGRRSSEAGAATGYHQVQIEDYPSPKQPLAFLFAGEKSLALWKETPSLLAQPRLRFRRFKDTADGNWVSLDLIPQTLGISGEFSDALGVDRITPSGGAWFFARKTPQVAGVDWMPENDTGYVGPTNQIFSYTAPGGSAIKDVKLLAMPLGTVVLVSESKPGGGTRFRAQRLYHPLFAYSTFGTVLIWETEQDVEIAAAAANELREIQVLLRTNAPLQPARLISLQVAPPLIGSVRIENGGNFLAETTGESGWNYLMEESRDLSTWYFSGNFMAEEGKSSWVRIWPLYPNGFFRAR